MHASLEPFAGLAAAGLDRADLTRILRELPFGVAVLDRERRTLFLNSVLERLTGFSSAEVAGVPCRHVLRGSFCLHHCPGLVAAKGDCPGASCAPEGRATESREGTLINRHRRKVPVRLTSVPVLDKGGALLCTLDVIEDLSALKELEGRLTRTAGPGAIVGRCAAMEHLLRILPAVAQSDATVLLTGESGTGKDLLAEALHRASPRARESFVRVNATPMPEALLDVELFGQAGPSGGQADEQGGGAAPRPGKFQLAQNGTLYLSEIADMPLAQQGRLLRLLDEKAVVPAGGERPMRLNVRVVAATGRDPEALVEAGLLRQDLFHRLNAVRLHLPPVRERGEDVQFLLTHFLGIYATKFRKQVLGFSEEALSLLSGYDYPGNVRELRNMVEYAVMVCPGELVLPDHLPPQVRFSAPSPASGLQGGGASPANDMSGAGKKPVARKKA
ncbi:MAG TPA: sigma 54-interacting transcriptional regulator [Humidesulfovibrio sp.]|uniref:sigma-54 interaction domain-containing protein n=1 Tax=Humidesulfovibrio sp. TaxID=2910988 RepID=UPI002C85DB99|nr:sigma 54-interacting transcriptional regulator [Humidesulfovibrio sp.]HWR03908.1 sigma 54-interacting transcriptional regulator [Humidesulfovibrio sp.]